MRRAERPVEAGMSLTARLLEASEVGAGAEAVELSADAEDGF
jgi:hypothetical protein